MDLQHELPFSSSGTLQVVVGNFPAQLTFEADTILEMFLSEAVEQFLPDMVVTLSSADGRRLKNGLKVATKLLDAETTQTLCTCTVMPFNKDQVDEQERRPCGDAQYFCKGFPVPLRAGVYLFMIRLEQHLYHADPIFRSLWVKHAPPHRIVICHETVGEELKQLEVKVIDIYGNLCSESSGKLRLNMTFQANMFSDEDMSEPCPLLSNSTGDLIAGGCKFERFEIGTGNQGAYFMKVFYGVESEHTISSESIHVLITSCGGNFIPPPYVWDRLRLLQLLTQDLEAQAQEKSQVHYERNVLRERLMGVEIKIETLKEEVIELREEESRLGPTHMIDKKFLEGEEILGPKGQTREDVQKAILRLPWPQSSPVDICEKRRQSRNTHATADTIFEMVVMLAGVEDNRFNRVLSTYLGVNNLLLIACETREELQQLNMFNNWNGHCELICLEELGIPINTNHRQQLLMLPEPLWDDGERPQGFLGFALNMVHLKPSYLHLRGTLFYHLLGESQVYDTELNMNTGLKNLRGRHRAMSLDGALVKDPCRQQLGQGGPVISFPSVSYAERSQCSLLRPVTDAFEREEKWNDLMKQILDRLFESARCQERKVDISMQMVRLEEKLISQTVAECELLQMTRDLIKQSGPIKPAAELIDFELSGEEYKMRAFLASVGPS